MVVAAVAQRLAVPHLIGAKDFARSPASFPPPTRLLARHWPRRTWSLGRRQLVYSRGIRRAEPRSWDRWRKASFSRAAHAHRLRRVSDNSFYYGEIVMCTPRLSPWESACNPSSRRLYRNTDALISLRPSDSCAWP